jgi:signal transduction histidine kinase
VSAIAIQAQAGRTTAPTDPEAALRALGVIEEEASNTLREMRAMVRLLRAGEEAEFAPRPGVADIARLADATGKPRIEVELVGDLDHLEPSVDTALYRLAQESITNARRHARHASRVMVHVAGEDGTVSLTVHDDGDGGATSGDPSGFGLAGMAERARLLGGSFAAGPDPGEGWSVRAVLPREESGA